jgi:hypothetical protein
VLLLAPSNPFGSIRHDFSYYSISTKNIKQMKKSLRLFSEQVRSLTGGPSNKLSFSLRLCSAIVVFFVLSLCAATVSGQNTNTVLGYNAFPAFSSYPSGQNTAIGTNVLNANTTGWVNTGVGINALYRNTTGINNTGIGNVTLYYNTTANDNTAIGGGALYSNVTGHRNTASGAYAMLYNTTGYENVANGFQALYSSTTGSWNTANGVNTLYSNTTGSYNTANGFQALFSNTTGSWNTANGVNTLYSNTTGSYNTANGFQALFSNMTGSHNTANGVNTLYSNKTGSDNTANGYNSMIANTTGNQNTANGTSALFSNTTGKKNTATGLSALYSNETGDGNTAIGMFALYSNETGNGNTGLGYQTDVLDGDLNNAMAIGNRTVVDASNKVQVGNTAVTSIGGQVGWTTFSDGRYKKDIQENVTGLAFINSLRPVTYTVDVAGLNRYFKKDRKPSKAIKGDAGNAALPKAAEEDPEAAKAAEEASKIVYDGFIAQEVEAAANKLGIPFSGVDKPKSKDGLYGLRYDNFVPQLVKSVQELSKMNDEKETKIEELQKQLEELKTLVLAKGQAANSSSSSSVVLTDAALGQNAPNPFNRTTVIPYTLPQKFTVAQIVITDQGGRVLRQVNLSGTGKGSLNVDAGTLAAGAYNYSLVVDGKVIGSKRMVLGR